MTTNQLYIRAAEVSASSVKAGLTKVFSDLRIGFKIVKTDESNANKGTIKIYNLSSDSRSFFENDDIKVKLNLGYGTILENAFSGAIGKNGIGQTTSTYQPPEWITAIEATDGGVEMDKSIISKSFGKGTPLKSIINDVISSFGLASGSQEFEGIEVLDSALSLTGKAKDVMDSLAKRLGIEWSVQNEAVQILKDSSNTSTTPETAVLITPTTGLVGSPIKTESGVKFRSLIIPRLLPGRACKLDENNVANGLFKVQRVTLEGDTHGQNWYADVEAI